jgi:hypothetical protein
MTHPPFIRFSPLSHAPHSFLSLSLYIFVFPGHSGGWIRSLGGSARYDALAFVYLFHSQPPRDTLGGGFVHLADPRVTTRWPLSICFAPSHPETLWEVDSSTWRVRALRRVGLYPFISLPASQRHSGGWIRPLGESARYDALVFIYLFHFQPPRDTLGGGFVYGWRIRALQRVGLCLFVSFPATQRHSGGWIRPLDESARYDALAFIYLFRFQPPRDTLGGGFVHLASPHVTTRWSLSTYFASSHPETLWGVDSFPWRICALRCVGIYPFISFPAAQRHSGGWTRLLDESARYDTLVFICLFRSQPPRDTLGGGFVCLANLHVTTCWLYLLRSLPSRDTLEGGFVCLVNLCIICDRDDK